LYGVSLIDVDDIDSIPSELIEVFRKLKDNNSFFDINGLRTFIEKYLNDYNLQIENCPHKVLFSTLTRNYLFKRRLFVSYMFLLNVDSLINNF